MNLPLDQRTDLPANLGMSLDASRDPAAPAVIEILGAAEPRRWSYGELDALTNAVARGLQAAGVQRGDRVGVMGANSVHALAVMLGTMRAAGAVSAPLNPRAGTETLAYMAEDSALKLLFADEAAAANAPSGPPVLALHGPAFEAFARPGRFDAIVPVPDEVALVLYTSGSTGRPKGEALVAGRVRIARTYEAMPPIVLQVPQPSPYVQKP